jgi:hypothetical protein
MSIHNRMTLGTYSNIRIWIFLLIMSAMSIAISVTGINIKIIVNILCFVINNPDGII